MANPLVFHRGNMSEYLAMYALNSFGFVVPVPRQADQFNVDVLVHLGKQPPQKNVWAHSGSGRSPST